MATQSVLRTVIIAALLAGFAPEAASQELGHRENFARAYALYTAGAHSQAKELFNKTLNAGYALEDYSLYYLALIAFQENNWDAARQLLSRIRQEFPLSIWYYPAELQRAKVAIAEQRFPPAIEILRSLRSAQNLKRDLSAEALYLQAQAQEAQEDVYQAYSLYQEVRSFAPLSQAAGAARTQVARLRDRHPRIFGISTATAISDEADLLVRERQFGAAETFYKKLLDRDLGPALRLRLLTKLSSLYLSVRRRNEAIPLLEEIARDFPKSSEASNALYQVGRILWNRNDNGQALDYFTRLMNQYPHAPQADNAQFAAAIIHESDNRPDDAIALYSALPKKFPNSKTADDATWRLAWLYYRAGDWQKAHDTLSAFANQSWEANYRTAAAYWQARTAEKLGKTDAAIRLLQEILSNAPESYYHALAVQGLGRAGIAAAESTPEAPPRGESSEPPPPSEAAFHLTRARELAELKLRLLAVNELDEIQRKGRSQDIQLLLVREYARNQAYTHSVRLAYQLPDASAERNLHRFPLAYWDAIREKGRERGIDPYLILALIRQESLFDARARSSAAALGLMQLLPATASRVGRQIGIAVPSNESLFDPDLNLTLGTQYLKDLLQRYSNNWFKAIAAYNAGEAAVDRWEQRMETDDIEEFVERIPYRETRQYVKLVMRNHRIYKRLYDQQK